MGNAVGELLVSGYKMNLAFSFKSSMLIIDWLRIVYTKLNNWREYTFDYPSRLM